MFTTSHPAADEHILDDLLADAAPALLVIGSPGCPVCAAATATVRELAEEYAGRVKVILVDAADTPGLLRRTCLGRLPGMVFVRAGRELARLAGAPPAGALRAWLNYTVYGGIQPPVPHGPSAPLPRPDDGRAASVGYNDNF